VDFSGLDTLAVWDIVGPVALVDGWVEDQVWRAADFLPTSGRALAKALSALSFLSHRALVLTRAKLVAHVWRLGGRWWPSGLVAAVGVVLVADGPGSAVHAVRPVAPLLLRVVKLLQTVAERTEVDFRNIIRALDVLHAVLVISIQAFTLGAIEVNRGQWGFAGPTVTIPLATVHQLRSVAPLPLVIVQKVHLAHHVSGATIITLPIP